MNKKNDETLRKVFNFLHQIENLKSTLRYPLTKSGRQESAADHSWRLSLMCFVVAKELNLDIDVGHTLKIAIVHDIAESITGDIDYVKIVDKKISKEEKQNLEICAMKKIKATLPLKTSEEIYALWLEYEEAKTREAKFVKAMDKLETLTQLIEAGYKTFDRPEIISCYANKAVEAFPELKEMLKILKEKLKKEFEKGNFEWKEEYN
jgi:putative hydrolases of HD superfamily